MIIVCINLWASPSLRSGRALTRCARGDVPFSPARGDVSALTGCDRDRSRRDACPTVRPRCFGVRQGFSGSEIAEQLRGVDLACFCPTRQPSGEFCGQTAGADFPGMLKIDYRVNLIVCHDRSPPGGDRASIGKVVRHARETLLRCTKEIARALAGAPRTRFALT